MVSTNPIKDIFTSTKDQIARVRELNAERSWGLTDEDFVTAEASVPEWTSGKLIAVTLVPYLPEAKGMGGVAHTFNELWKVSAASQRYSRHSDYYDKTSSDFLQLLKGIEHPVKAQPVLRWEVINLGCNLDCRPEEVRKPETSPHAGILASAMLHPEWVKAMDGDNIPYVFLPGYEITTPGRTRRLSVPFLRFSQDDSEILLLCYLKFSCDSSWSVPSFFWE